MGPCWRPSGPAPDRKNHGNYKVWGQKFGGFGQLLETNSRGGFSGVFWTRMASILAPLLVVEMVLRDLKCYWGTYWSSVFCATIDMNIPRSWAFDMPELPATGICGHVISNCLKLGSFSELRSLQLLFNIRPSFRILSQCLRCFAWATSVDSEVNHRNEKRVELV